jgi:hypothetical protein
VSKPLDEAVWQAWVKKGRAEERRDGAAGLILVKLISLAALATMAAAWSSLGPYDAVARFIVTAGAIFLMFRAFRTDQHAFSAVFAVLAVLYNPVGPVLAFSGDWQRALVVVSAAPFVASLLRRQARTERNG